MSPAASGLPRVLIADRSDEGAAWLEGVLSDHAEVRRTDSAEEAQRVLQGLRPHALVVGSKLKDMPGATFLEQLGRSGADAGLSVFFLVDPKSTAPVPDHDSVYYVLSPGMSAEDVAAIFDSAFVPANFGDERPSPGEAQRMRRLLEVPRLFAQQTDLKGAARVATRALHEFLSAERAECLFYDQTGGALWTEGRGDEKYQGGREMPARLGLAGFAARTGHAVCVDSANEDPRYHREVDDPEGHGDERILAQPVADSDFQVHAVLIAVRPSTAPAFSAEDRSLGAWLAQRLGPLTGQLALQLEAESVLEEALEDEQRLFRREAMAAYDEVSKRGDVIRVSPKWITWSYWLLVGLLVGIAVFSVVGRVNEYSMGPAVVYDSGHAEITAPVAGNVQSVAVEPGDRVEAGQVLARIHAAGESAELARLEQEWQSRLREYLASPANREARSALGAIRAERQRMRERLTVRADRAGVVQDLRAAPGQRVVAGQTIVSLNRPDGQLELIALLPGGDRPLLRSGMSLRLELQGYQYAYQELEVSSVASEVVGPAQAKRFLGVQLADSVPVAGPVVIVKAKLEKPTFEADDETYAYHHGMQGIAEVKVRSTTVLGALIPGID